MGNLLDRAARNSAEETIEKTIETSDFLSGGLLNAEQQDRFVVLVKRFSTLIPMSRFVRMPQPAMDIDKLHVGEPVSESATENTASTNYSKPKFNKITLNAKKLRSLWNISTETLQSNIEQNTFEDTVMMAMTERIATDLEMLVIQGDDSLTGTDPRQRLLKTLDGLDVQSDAAHIVDAGGAPISKNLFSAAKRALPTQYKNDPGLRWFVSDTIATDWMDLLSDRATGVGDSALQGTGIAPFGIPMVVVPMIPDDKSVGIAAASSADVVGDQYGPFVITTGTNDGLVIDVDNAGATAITLPGGTLDQVTVLNQINGQLVTALGSAYANVAQNADDGRIRLVSPTTGAASEIDVQAGTANTTLGLTVAVTTGAAAGSGSQNEGSFIWLTNPQNFVVGMLDGTRIFTDFNKDYDRIESVVYNQIDVDIENLDSLVKITNIRRRDLA